MLHLVWRKSYFFREFTRFLELPLSSRGKFSGWEMYEYFSEDLYITNGRFYIIINQNQTDLQ